MQLDKRVSCLTGTTIIVVQKQKPNEQHTAFLFKGKGVNYAIDGGGYRHGMKAS